MLYLLASYVARKRRAEEVRDSQLTRVGRLRVSQAPGFRRTACAPGRVTLIPRVGTQAAGHIEYMPGPSP